MFIKNLNIKVKVSVKYIIVLNKKYIFELYI